MGYAIQPEDLPLIFKEYESLASSYLEARGREGAFHFFHFSIESENEICMKKRVGGCGSGTEYLAVAPSGDLYPCHQFVGQEGFLLGNVNGGFSEEGNALRHKFSSLNVNSKEECRNCWAKYFCGGGCAANAFQYGSGLAGTHPIGCAMLKKRLECALYIKSVEKH
jgi:uncharacterized protein